MDLLIKNGTIIDGRGGSRFKADIGIESDKIVKIGTKLKKAENIIDATGLVVSPGFIDMHSHSDFTLLSCPHAESMIQQGVTTEVIGNCGLTTAPVTEERLDSLRKYLGPFSATGDFEWDWRSFGDFLDYLEDKGVSINVASLVGHGAVRIAVMGSKSAKPSEDELEDMKKLVRESMEGGAFGISSGLIYPPGLFSDTEELIELSKVAKEYNGIYSTHVRSEGDGLIESIKEAIKIGEVSGISVQISHHKVTGKPNWGAVKETLRLIDDARKNGLNVNCDQYPYTASNTILSSLIPNWAQEGGYFKLKKRLKDEENRKRIKQEISEGIPGWENPAKDTGWKNIVISSVFSKKNKHLEGMSILDIAKSEGKDPADVVFDILIQEINAMIVIFEMCEEDVKEVMKHPLTMIGSDGIAISQKGMFGAVNLHPRSYGTFPRVLGKYVREDHVLSLEEAIFKMTFLPAQKLGLEGRGSLKEKMYADITIFDPEKIIDKATYTKSNQYPEGIEYVLVNGAIVVKDGGQNDILAGRILRR